MFVSGVSLFIPMEGADGQQTEFSTETLLVQLENAVRRVMQQHSSVDQLVLVQSGFSRMAPADVDDAAVAAPVLVATVTVVATMVADSVRTIPLSDHDEAIRAGPLLRFAMPAKVPAERDLSTEALTLLDQILAPGGHELGRGVATSLFRAAAVWSSSPLIPRYVKASRKNPSVALT